MDPTPKCIEKGDLKAGFEEADHLLEGEMRVGGQVGTALNSTSVDELWNWCHQRLVGGGMKIQGTAGRFHGNPVSGNKPCNGHPADQSRRQLDAFSRD